MKTRARRVSKNKTSHEIKSDIIAVEISKKPSLTVISHDEVADKQTSVRPKVNTYPKRIKEVVRVEMKAANSNLPEIEMPGAVDLDAPVDHIANDMNTPPSTRFDWSFAMWLVALVVAVNLALLMLVGSPSKSTTTKLTATVPASAPIESGVVVKGTVAEEPTTAMVVKPAAIKTNLASISALVAVAAPVNVPATVGAPVAKPVPVAAKPAPDLLSIINQNN